MSTNTYTVTVTIGRNVGENPMTDGPWAEFKFEARSLLVAVGGTLYVDGAEHVGEWDGIREDNCTYVAALTNVPRDALTRAYRRLARKYKQDAIAVTYGETVLAG